MPQEYTPDQLEQIRRMNALARTPADPVANVANMECKLGFGPAVNQLQAQTKGLRAIIKGLVDLLNASEHLSLSRSLAIIKLDEASVWLGKDLQEWSEPDPYPTSRDPAVAAIDPPALEATNCCCQRGECGGLAG